MTRLSKYELLEQIGRGGFGTVYRALDTVLEVERAVKVLHPPLIADPEFIERFQHEAKLSARLIHPNVVPVFDLEQNEGRYYKEDKL
jgi:serine/threonine protein kinase